LVKVKQWTWEYIFNEDGSVIWHDIYNNEGGKGRWASSGQLINIFWNGSATRESWPFPINPDNQKVWYDASYAKGWFQAIRTIRHEPGAMSFEYTVLGEVPIIIQPSPVLCWAAGAAMMIAWRLHNPGMSLNAAIDTMGEPFITLLKQGNGLTTANYEKSARDFEGKDMYNHYAHAAGLKYEPLRSYTPKQLYELMVRYHSPLLVLTNWNTTWMHANVFKRMWGSTDTMQIIYNDPFEQDEQQDSFIYLIKKMEGGAKQSPIQVLHY
jgi:hypothetical protein